MVTMARLHPGRETQRSSTEILIGPAELTFEGKHKPIIEPGISNGANLACTEHALQNIKDLA